MKGILNYYMFLLISITFIFAVGCGEDSVSVTPENKKLEQTLDKMCDSVLKNTNVPGMIIGVWDSSKSLVYVKGHGYANIETKKQMRPELNFRIGGLTKTFTVTLILQLVNEGLISLDDKLSDYIPEFPRGDEVTIRMLCDMTSGIYNYTESAEFENIIENDPHHVWITEDMTVIIEGKDYYFNPGTNFRYSNTNTVLLGKIIEILLSRSLNDILADRIFSELQLSNTFYTLSYTMPSSEFASGYMNYTDQTKFTDDVTEKYNASMYGPAGGMISNIYDLKKWIDVLLNGNGISTALQSQRFQGRNVPGSQLYYALGISSYSGTEMWGYEGDFPGYSSIMMRNKTNGKTIIICYNNQGNTKPKDLFLQIEKLLR